jgi:predicted nucleotidyltransferase
MDDFYLKVIGEFNKNEVEYMVVGGFAVNFHGYNRSTGDLDLWISKSETNLNRLSKAFNDLGFEFTEDAKSELRENHIISFSEENAMVELMTRLNISQQISFEEALAKADKRMVQEIEVIVISFEDLKNEKAHSRRYKDLDDLSKLEEAEAYYAKRLKKE